MCESHSNLMQRFLMKYLSDTDTDTDTGTE